jgi:FHS family glucose/mannose:H+ symporter-like MFS transporter
MRRLGVYAEFAATGVGLTLPGALLPGMLHRWGWSDAAGGWLLFAFFVGCTGGALISRGRMTRSVARGCGLTALGAWGLALVGPQAAFAAMGVFGLGLGVAMTSASLLMSRRFPADRRSEMTRLNLLWSLGAVAGPVVGLGWRRAAVLSVAHEHRVWLGLGGVFAAFALWFLLMEEEPASGRVESAGLRAPVASLGVALMVLVFCQTGVEAATGGWMATYAARVDRGAHAVVGAATCLWLGSLVSRAVFSTRRAERVSERSLLTWNMLLMAAGLAVVLVWQQSWATMAGAAVVGFAAGPVYPLLLAMVLRRREVPWIFAWAGLGSAVVPMVTGQVSSAAGSLRAGLGVPLGLAMMMAGFGFLGTREGEVAVQGSDEAQLNAGAAEE